MKFLRIHWYSFVITLLLFVVEALIALYVHDNFVRPFLGDVIVVWLVYYFLKSFLVIKPIYLALFTLFFAFAVEFGQYAKLIHILGLQEYKWAQIVIGTSFSWWDILCYFVGFLLLFVFDKHLRKNH